MKQKDMPYATVAGSALRTMLNAANVFYEHFAVVKKALSFANYREAKEFKNPHVLSPGIANMKLNLVSFNKTFLFWRCCGFSSIPSEDVPSNILNRLIKTMHIEVILRKKKKDSLPPLALTQ